MHGFLVRWWVFCCQMYPSRTPWPLAHDPREGMHALDGIVAWVTPRYHPGLIALISQIAILGGGAYIQILMFSLLSVCLLLWSLPSQVSVDFIVIPSAILSTWSPTPGNSALFFLSLLSGGWMLLEENSSNLKNVASVNIWCPPGLAGWPCNFPLCLVNFFSASSVACYVFLQAWPTSPDVPFPFADLLCILSL